jgi:hypothetical protein
MTLTVKLDSTLRERLRQRAVADHCTASELVRLALVGYLDSAERGAKPSAMELGRGLFPELPRAGAVARPELVNLATHRKAELAKIWDSKASARQSKSVHAPFGGSVAVEGGKHTGRHAGKRALGR